MIPADSTPPILVPTGGHEYEAPIRKPYACFENKYKQRFAFNTDTYPMEQMIPRIMVYAFQEVNFIGMFTESEVRLQNARVER